MELSRQQGQLAVDLQGDHPGQGGMYQLELLVPSASLLHQRLEIELALVDLLNQRLDQRSGGGGKAQPARQTTGGLGGAAGAGAVIPIGRQGGGQCLVAAQVTHLNLADGVVLFALCDRGEGIDMGLLQFELVEQGGQLIQRGFNGLHLLTQGGGRGKGIHR